jgi:CMP-N-acetylneuraminic acid synthetase
LIKDYEKNVTVILAARTASSRCPRKVIKPFSDGKNLFEIMCKKLNQLDFPFAAGVGDSELIDIAERYHVPIFQRSQEEVNASTPLVKVFKCVEQCKTSHAMLISPCTPFLEVETINSACRDFCESKDWESLSAVVKEQNWFFNENREPLVPINIHHMTTNELCVYALANAFEIFPVERFLKEGIWYTFTNPNDPYLYEMPKSEAHDVDDQDDFELSQHVWEHRLKTENSLKCKKNTKV